jgi:nitrogenase-associated protein
MAHLVFYEKTGCCGNARQRALLQAAGHTLTRRDLLATPWTAKTLLAFLQPLPVAQWFNRAAPRIRSGELVPEALAAGQALELLLADPLLIRRPLMQREDGSRLVGFDATEVDRFVGLQASQPWSEALEGCAAQPPAAVPLPPSS